MSKPAPVEGMKVTWVEPSEDPKNSEFIESHLIGKIGRDGLTVNSIDILPTGHVVIVTLQRGGQVIESSVNKNKPAWFKWSHIRLLPKQDDSGHSEFGAGLS